MMWLFTPGITTSAWCSRAGTWAIQWGTAARRGGILTRWTNKTLSQGAFYDWIRFRRLRPAIWSVMRGRDAVTRATMGWPWGPGPVWGLSHRRRVNTGSRGSGWARRNRGSSSSSSSFWSESACLTRILSSPCSTTRTSSCEGQLYKHLCLLKKISIIKGVPSVFHV